MRILKERRSWAHEISQARTKLRSLIQGLQNDVSGYFWIDLLHCDYRYPHSFPWQRLRALFDNRKRVTGLCEIRNHWVRNDAQCTASHSFGCHPQCRNTSEVEE